MVIYLVSGISREYPEDSNHWNYRAYTSRDKAQQVCDLLNTESERIFQLPSWKEIVSAIAVSRDVNMKHGDDAAEYYIEELELDEGE